MATNATKTLSGWSETDSNFDGYCKPGDQVDKKLVDYFADILPPTTLNGGMVQVGEPYSHEEDETGQWRAIYATFAKREGQWVYCGNCFKGRDTEPCTKRS